MDYLSLSNLWPPYYASSASSVVVVVPLANIRKAVHAFILTDATVASIVAGRVFPSTIPEDQPYPAITWQLISDVGELILSGRPARLTKARIQLAATSEDLSEAVDAALALKALFNGFTGLMGGLAMVTRCKVEDGPDNRLTKDDGRDLNPFRITMDAMVTYERLKPASSL